MISLVTIISAIFLGFGHFAVSTPEHEDCDWGPRYEIVRMRDLSDCRKFYYCKNEGYEDEVKPPYPASCPISSSYFTLYYNPNTTQCDLFEPPPECVKIGNTYQHTTTTTTTTTTPPTTTTKKPKPPPLEEKPEMEIDCVRRGCGLFANAYGACNTYLVCINGKKVTKKCHEGQLFDMKTKECQPAHLATCWKEPNAGPHITGKGKTDCPFHNKPAGNPAYTTPDGIVLQNSPTYTNWGYWQKYVECPKGTFATGLYAWRRVLIQGWERRMDHAGIVSLSLRCQTPGGNETDMFIESLAPGLSHDGWPMYYMCRGAMVGFQVNSVRYNGWGWDNLATDNILGLCSCSGPVYKPYEQQKYAPQNGNRGDWTNPQYCRRGQAVCGMQTQMQQYIEWQVGQYDNTGMNNIQVKCCDVPDPLEKCVPKEERILVRECDNSDSEYQQRCEFNAMIGLAMDISSSNEKTLEFYSSVGYDLSYMKSNISERIETKLNEESQNGANLEYSWDDVAAPVRNEMKIFSQTLYVKPFEKVEVYQVVGSCNFVLERTNTFFKVSKSGNRVKQSVKFEI